MKLPVPTDIVLGPPGTGKTTELLRRVDDLLQQGIPPDRIGYYAFTRRAASEAQTRAMDKFGLRRADLPHFRTIHSECMQQMGLASSQVLDGDRLQEFADWIGERITGKFSMEDGLLSGSERGDRLLFMDGLARVRCRPLRDQYDEDNDDLDWATVERFSAGLAEYKEAHGLVDYTQMLELFWNKGPKGLGLHTVIFDEAQDMTALQWLCARRLALNSDRAIVAGDDDQAIYRWAGADANALMELEGNASVLGQSWRVPRAIQQVAHGVLGRVRHRRPKDWLPRPEDGHVTYASSLQEIDWSGEVLVLARNQYVLEPVMQELRACGVLYEHRGRPSVKQSTLDAVVTWERLRHGASLPVHDVRNMLQCMEVGVGVARGHKTLPRVPPDTYLDAETLRRDHGMLAPASIWHEALTGLPASERAYMVRCRRRGERFSQPPRVRVGTIHDSKGGERDHVVLLTDMAPRTHNEMHKDEDSEHRVWYVATTRARKELTIVQPRTWRHYEL